MPPFAPSEIVSNGESIAYDVADPIRGGYSRHTWHIELGEPLSPWIAKVSIRKSEDIVPRLGLASEAGRDVRAVKGEAEFICFCHAKGVQIGHLHILIE